MVNKGEGRKRAANLGAKHFRDQPLAELCMEDALKSGAERSAKLKPEDFVDTSMRFCVPGLRDWLAACADDCYNGSFRALLRDISWQWASFCETNPAMITARKIYIETRREIVENTAYTDLVERLRQSPLNLPFSMGARIPTRLVLPRETAGVIGRTGEALGISFPRFLQVGFVWSMSTRRDKKYKVWSDSVAAPLVSAVLEWASSVTQRANEVRIVMDYLSVNPRGGTGNSDGDFDF